MGIRGTGRKKRLGFVEELAESDPEAAAKLLELRHASPAKYRKRIRSLAKKSGRHSPTSGAKLDVAPTPGRATDPKLRVGPGGDDAAAGEAATPTEPDPEAAAEAPKKKKKAKA